GAEEGGHTVGAVRRQVARRVALRGRLDLDHARAQVRQHLRGVGPGQVAREVQDDEAVEHGRDPTRPGPPPRGPAIFGGPARPAGGTWRAVSATDEALARVILSNRFA